MFKTILSTVAFVIGLGSASLHAAPNKVVYELQERCATRSEVFFKHLGYSEASFENHYNANLNGCFLLVTITKTQTGKGVTWFQRELWDVNENRQLDLFAFVPGPKALVSGTPEFACVIGDFMKCPGGKQFGANVLLYMER
jgi:hypothetical protein